MKTNTKRWASVVLDLGGLIVVWAMFGPRFGLPTLALLTLAVVAVFLSRR